MIRGVLIAILLSIWYSASHEQNQTELELEYQDVPVKCQSSGLDKLNCCHIPPFFAQEKTKFCTAYFEYAIAVKSNLTIYRRRLMRAVSWECILQTYHLITKNKFLYEDKYFTHLQEWADLNSDFKAPLLKAKTLCTLDMKLYKPHAPITAYNYNRLHRCLRYYIQSECPTSRLVYTAKCDAQRKWFDECRIYFW